jgi:hypothetical protein
MLNDDGKLKRKFINKRVNAAKEGIEFDLTYSEFKSLVLKAGLVSSDLGFTGRGYVLARRHDVGPYRVGNCRFITQKENASERKVSKRSSNASRKNQKKAASAAMKVFRENPKLLVLGGKRGAATRNIQRLIECLEKDILFIHVPVDTCAVSYPDWGWKTRLATELGTTKRSIDLFLKRTPDYLEILSQ